MVKHLFNIIPEISIKTWEMSATNKENEENTTKGMHENL
jgi:hypothetical protein